MRLKLIQTGEAESKTPASGATEAGAGRYYLRRGATADLYPTATTGATVDLDCDAPQPVVAYVSRSIVYVLDESLNVVAYGRLTRCGVRS